MNVAGLEQTGSSFLSCSSTILILLFFVLRPIDWIEAFRGGEVLHKLGVDVVVE